MKNKRQFLTKIATAVISGLMVASMVMAVTTISENIVTAGDLAVNGGDVTTTATTFNLVNAAATTVNFAGAGTTISVGAATGTSTVNNALTVTGALTANGNVTLGDGVTDTITLSGGKITQGTSGSPLAVGAVTGVSYKAAEIAINDTMATHTTDSNGLYVVSNAIPATLLAGESYGIQAFSNLAATGSGQIPLMESGYFETRLTTGTIGVAADYMKLVGLHAVVVGDGGTMVGPEQDSFVAGLLADYDMQTGTTNSITGSEDGVTAAIIGHVKDGEADNIKPDAAILSFLSGDSGSSITAGAAFKVMDYNSTSPNDFDYGLDFGSGAGGPIGGPTGVTNNTFQSADIRLMNDETIDNVTDGKIAFSGGYVDVTRSLSSQTTENNANVLSLTTDSTFLSGSNMTYSGGYGSSALKITGTYSGIDGGYSNIYSNITTSGAHTADGAGVIGIKSVVTNTVALSDGEVYGGLFIAKHDHATNIMTASASLIGIEGWGYDSGVAPARTVIGGNFGYHNEGTTAKGDGSVYRGVQIFTDDGAGASEADERTSLALWNMAGTQTDGIKFIKSDGGWTTDITLQNGATIVNGGAATLTITEPTITLAGSTKINLDGPVDVSGLLVHDAAVATALEFNAAASASYILIGTNESTLQGSIIPASPSLWDGIGVFVETAGAAGRAASMSNEDHGINSLIQNTGEVYFQFGVQGRGYTSGVNATTIESYGVFGRARTLSSGTVGNASTGALIGVLGEADNKGVLDVGGSGIMAGGRFIFNNSGTLTSGTKTALMGQITTGVADSVLYLLNSSGATVTNIIDINDAGTSTNLLKLRSATAGGTEISAMARAANAAEGSLKIDVAGTTYYIPIYNARD